MPATEALLLELAMRMRLRDVFAIVGQYGTIGEWVGSRLRGLSWVLVEDRPIAAIGVFDDGYVWLAPAADWARRLKTMIRVWKEIVRSGAYPRLRCQCDESDRAARRLAECTGFHAVGAAGGLIDYEVAS